MTIICFSHLRWDFVYQRPQHLLSRFAQQHTIYFIEEPLFYDEADANITHVADENLYIVKPHLNKHAGVDEIAARQKNLLEKLLDEQHISNYIFWYYSPMMFLFSKTFNPSLLVYDCMDELSAFKFAPPALKQAEDELFQKADVVFTGGNSLFEAKRNKHHNIYPFPSSIDKKHFVKARLHTNEPPDQQHIPSPRLGFFGVLDERFDVELIKEAAAKKPAWSFVFIGPVVKIHPDELPQADNIFYLGAKSYNELPAYISGWDIALIPFVINESTRFISPTKTPEYLAAGKPVISTAIKDIVSPYGEQKLASIVYTPNELVEAATELLLKKNRQQWLMRVDEFLSANSWDNTSNQMLGIVEKALNKEKYTFSKKDKIYV